MVGAVLVPVLTVAAVYLLFFTPSSPDRLQVSTPAGRTGATAPLMGEVDGTWRPAPETVVGYRVREKLAGLPASSDAVGRTNAVSGSVRLVR